MDPIAIGLLALLFSGGKKGGTGGSGSTPQGLVARATQPKAAAWVPYFLDIGALPALADALSRWAGIESGGDSSALSSLGERGLLQAGKQTVSEGGMSQADWDEYGQKDGLPNTQASISSKYAAWLFSRAAKHLDSPPTDPIDEVWFAYQYHQRPKDFTQWGKLPSKASDASSYLTARGKANSDPSLIKRVNASDIVAWGRPNDYTGLV